MQCCWSKAWTCLAKYLKQTYGSNIGSVDAVHVFEEVRCGQDFCAAQSLLPQVLQHSITALSVHADLGLQLVPAAHEQGHF